MLAVRSQKAGGAERSWLGQLSPFHAVCGHRQWDALEWVFPSQSTYCRCFFTDVCF